MGGGCPLARHTRHLTGAWLDGLGGDVLINALFLNQGRVDTFRDLDALVEQLLPAASHLQLVSDRLSAAQTDGLRERVYRLLRDLPESPNRVTLFYFTSRTRREIALQMGELLGAGLVALRPYLDYDLVDQSLCPSRPGANLSFIGSDA